MRRFFLLLTASCCLLLFIASASSASTYNVLDYGADPTGLKKSTQAIQKAIDLCHENGGGDVIIPAGLFITGTLLLKDHVNLNLTSGAVLKGSLDLKDYDVAGEQRGMIFASYARNIAITGLGEMNGNGTAFMNFEKGHTYRDFDRSVIRQGEAYIKEDLWPDGPVSYERRPGMMVVLLNCENVKIQDITFRDSPEWTIRLGQCDNVQIRGITILNNLLIPNSDGIHCTTSRNVSISDCDIRVGDDAVIVTGFSNEIDVHGKIASQKDDTSPKIGNQTGVAENITVTNCQLQSRSAGIRVGYGENPIRNCVFSNLVIWGSNRGIGVFARDNADIENILFSNITIDTRLHSGIWWGNGESIHISAIPRNKNVPVGHIRNIQFHNILATAETGLLIYGIKESVLEDILLDNVRLTIRNGPLDESYGGNFDLRPTADFKDGIFKHDIPGIYAQYVQNLKIVDFHLKWDQKPREYCSYGIQAEHVNQLTITGFKGRSANGDAAIFHKSCSNVIIRD